MKRSSILIMTVLAVLMTAGISAADDTSIYGVQSISVQPNVLIIFDNSGSMDTQDVPGDKYDPTQTYAGSYDSNAVYRKGSYCWNCYQKVTNDVDNINCSNVKTALKTSGLVKGRLKLSNLSCNGNKRWFYMGNYLNYDAAGGAYRTRIDVAKEVITNLITNTDNVRFGLMKFHRNDTDSNSVPAVYRNGGEVVEGLGASKADLISAVDSLTADGNTPLAETMAEAGLYYAGKQSWYNADTTYTSPIQYRCQKNYIIIMTDGEPTEDSNSKLTESDYIFAGQKIADYNQDGQSGKLDDVASLLYEKDLRPDLGESGGSFEKQNVITYTIGFTTNQTLLQKTASEGGGAYYTASSISDLEAAFNDIMATIAEVNAVFVSPVVPVSRMNRTFAGNSLYIGFFKPQVDGRWAGNIKKYGLDSNGALIDQNGNPATLDDGTIRDNAQSFWSDTPDGQDVQKGGVGGRLLDQASRNLYTYLGTSANLTDSSNAFAADNTSLTQALLDVTDSTERTNVINDTIGADRSWILGDILHSQPVVVHYDTNSDGQPDTSYIFAGANDGIMHAFSDSTGDEIWGFIPPDQLGRLQLLSDNNSVHDYFVDGAPAAFDSASQKILFFGERRGGSNYYALDITTATAPKWLYQITSDCLVNVDGNDDGIDDGVNATLGQSWGTPSRGQIKISSGDSDSDSQTVFFLPGGYDVNQDLQTPQATDTVGRAVFSINVATGAVSKLDFNGGNYSAMTHCITDVSVFDSNGDGFVNRAYAGDLGGNVFAFEDDNGDGTWTARKLFSASADGVQRKIMYAPDVTLETYGDLVFFGTGDRADPEKTDVVNRLYAVKNEWADSASTLTEDDLLDVTSDQVVLGTEADRAAAEAALKTKKGWYIKLENAGEKITSQVTVFGGVVYFTTYTPGNDASDSGDVCDTGSGNGQARLYAVDYKTGKAVFNWNSDTETDGDGNTVALGKKDRCKIIGDSIPSAPVIAVLPGGPEMYIGVEGGVRKEDPLSTTATTAYYWRQLN